MMESWQDWIVALILLLCVARVFMGVKQLYQKSKRPDDNPCSHCSQPCDIKRIYDQKVQNCRSDDKKTKKSCCE